MSNSHATILPMSYQKLVRRYLVGFDQLAVCESEYPWHHSDCLERCYLCDGKLSRWTDVEEALIGARTVVSFESH